MERADGFRGRGNVSAGQGEGHGPRVALGASGAVLAALAIVAGVMHLVLGPITGPRTLEEAAYDTARSVRDAVVAGIRGEEYQPPPDPGLDPDDLVRVGVTVAGALAILLGIGGFLRRESLAMGAAAMSLGTTAIVLQVSIVIAGIIAGLFLLYIVLTAFGFDLSG